jgi:hypothetical protein
VKVGALSYKKEGVLFDTPSCFNPYLCKKFTHI